MDVINSLAPVFLIIALGAFLAKTNFFGQEILKGLNRVTYWVGLPCLLFVKIATAEYQSGPTSRIFLVVILGMAGCMLIGYLTAWFLRIPSKATGTFIQAAFRGNLAFIGLPVVIYAAGNSFGNQPYDLQTLAILVIAPMVPIYNLTSVVVLLLSQHELNWQSFKKIFWPIVTNPLLIAAVLGGSISLLPWNLPAAIARTSEAIGQMSLPLALISIGGSLVVTKIRGRVLFSTIAALIKTGIAPIVGYVAILYLGLNAVESQVALIYLACPTAATSFVMAEQLGGDMAIAASSVVISTILSSVSLAVVIGFF